MIKPGAAIKSVDMGCNAARASSGPTRAFSLKELLGVTAAVLLAHLLLLLSPLTPGLSQNPNQPVPNRAFTTRAVEPPALPSRWAKPPASPAPAVPRPRKNAPVAQNKIAALPAQAMPAPSPATTDPLLLPAPPAPDQPASAPVRSPERPGASPEPASEMDRLASAPPPPREMTASTTYALPDSVRLKYQVKANKFPYGLNSELRWDNQGDGYDARLEIGAFGLGRVQTSRGQITEQGLAPLRFSDKNKSEVAAHFVRSEGKITFSANTPDAPLLTGAQDRLSILFHVAGMIAGAPEQYASAATISIQTIGPRDADTWLFTVGSTEVLNLPGGQQVTLKLTRNPRHPYDQRVEMWLAPALGYLPARLKITEFNGDYIDQQWLSSESPP